MGSVCGSTLSLLDAGVPLKAPVSGTAMGLIKEGKEVRILTIFRELRIFLEIWTLKLLVLIRE